MLRELAAQNLATIEDVRITLEPGMLAWTGETGAGKSLLLHALGLVLGEKASADLVRAGKPEATASAVFDLTTPALRARVEAILGGPVEDAQLILIRRIAASGRSQAHANGMPVPNSTLRALGACLIDIHGQHEGRALLDPDYQRMLLDAYGRHEGLLAGYRKAHESHEELRKRRIDLRDGIDRRLRERELLEFELQELSSASPSTGEYAELVREAHRLSHAGAFRSAAREGYGLLYEVEGSAQERLVQAARRLAGVADGDTELAAIVADLKRLAEESRDLARQLQHATDRFDDNPQRLEQIEERLERYRKLATRFRCTPDELEAVRDRIAAQLAGLEQDETDLAGLDEALKESWSHFRAAHGRLTGARKKVAAELARAIQGELKSLCLGRARIAICAEPVELATDPTTQAPSEQAADRLEFLLKPNPGEPPRPLRKIASGGELSRVTLAIKTVLANVDDVPTVVFDEVDTGVGGRLGAALGKLVKKLSARRQVLCITHLPQLASHARHHWVVRKQVRKGRSHTAIRKLDELERVAELAAMLRGETAGESTRQEAQAMLAEARAVR